MKQKQKSKGLFEEKTRRGRETRNKRNTSGESDGGYANSDTESPENSNCCTPGSDESLDLGKIEKPLLKERKQSENSLGGEEAQLGDTRTGTTCAEWVCPATTTTTQISRNPIRSLSVFRQSLSGSTIWSRSHHSFNNNGRSNLGKMHHPSVIKQVNAATQGGEQCQNLCGPFVRNEPPEGPALASQMCSSTVPCRWNSESDYTSHSSAQIFGPPCLCHEPSPPDNLAISRGARFPSSNSNERDYSRKESYTTTSNQYPHYRGFNYISDSSTCDPHFFLGHHLVPLGYTHPTPKEQFIAPHETICLKCCNRPCSRINNSSMMTKVQQPYTVHSPLVGDVVREHCSYGTRSTHDSPIVAADSIAVSLPLYLQFRHFAGFGEGELPPEMFRDNSFTHQIVNDEINEPIEQVHLLFGPEMKISSPDITVLIPQLGLIHARPDFTFYEKNAFVFCGSHAMESASCCLMLFRSSQPSAIDIRRAVVHSILASMSATRPLPLYLTNLGRISLQLIVQLGPKGFPIVSFTSLGGDLVTSILHLQSLRQTDSHHSDHHSSSNDVASNKSLNLVDELRKVAEAKCGEIERNQLKMKQKDSKPTRGSLRSNALSRTTKYQAGAIEDNGRLDRKKRNATLVTVGVKGEHQDHGKSDRTTSKKVGKSTITMGEVETQTPIVKVKRKRGRPRRENLPKVGEKKMRVAETSGSEKKDLERSEKIRKHEPDIAIDEARGGTDSLSSSCEFIRTWLELPRAEGRNHQEYHDTRNLLVSGENQDEHLVNVSESRKQHTSKKSASRKNGSDAESLTQISSSVLQPEEENNLVATAMNESSTCEINGNMKASDELNGVMHLSVGGTVVRVEDGMKMKHDGLRQYCFDWSSSELTLPSSSDSSLQSDNGRRDKEKDHGTEKEGVSNVNKSSRITRKTRGATTTKSKAEVRSTKNNRRTPKAQNEVDESAERPGSENHSLQCSDSPLLLPSSDDVLGECRGPKHRSQLSQALEKFGLQMLRVKTEVPPER